MNKVEAVDLFSGQETQRITRSLDLILPHLSGAYAFVGGLAIRHYAAQHGQETDRPFNDLDLIAEPAAVSPDIQDFIVFHNHPANGRLIIVEPESRVKVDIFGWPLYEPTVSRITYQGMELPLQSAEDQLAKTVYDARRVCRGGVVDPKQFDDAGLLMTFSDHESTLSILAAWEGGTSPSSLQEALQEARDAADSHPERLQTKPFHRSEAYECERCDDTADYRLTPLVDMYDLLGYVE